MAGMTHLYRARRAHWRSRLDIARGDSAQVWRVLERWVADYLQEEDVKSLDWPKTINAPTADQKVREPRYDIDENDSAFGPMPKIKLHFRDK